MGDGESVATRLQALVDERTVNVNEELDEDEFFSNPDGTTTVANRYDLEKAVPMEKKLHFVEKNRYWVNKPYAYIVIFKSQKENEYKYYVVEPYLTEIEHELKEFLSQKLKTAIKYSEDDVIVQGSETDRAEVIQREAERLLTRYDLFTGERYERDESDGVASPFDDDRSATNENSTPSDTEQTNGESGGFMNSLVGLFGDGESDDAAPVPSTNEPASEVNERSSDSKRARPYKICGNGCRPRRGETARRGSRFRGAPREPSRGRTPRYRG